MSDTSTVPRVLPGDGRRLLRLAAVAIIAVALAACGTNDGGAGASPGSTGAAPASQAPAVSPARR